MSLFTYVNILWIFYDFISLRHLIAHFPPSKHSSSSSFILFVSTARLTERWTNGARRDSRWNSNKKREESSRDSLIRSVTDEWANVSTAAESDEDDEVRTSMWWKNQKPIKNTWELRDAFSHPLTATIDRQLSSDSHKKLHRFPLCSLARAKLLMRS